MRSPIILLLYHLPSLGQPKGLLCLCWHGIHVPFSFSFLAYTGIVPHEGGGPPWIVGIDVESLVCLVGN